MAENKSLFNSSASSTYKEHTNSSYSYYMGYGHLGEDLLGIADTLFNITFSLIESPSFSWLYTNVDGYLGLATGKLPGRSETIPLVKQLEKDLDNPVISVWKQQLNNHNASYILTLGAYDTTNCENAWNNVPRLTAPDTCFGKTTAATVHVNSITTTFRGNDVRIALNKSMIIDQNCIDFYGHNYLYGFMPYYIKFLFTSAVKARLSNQVSITSSYAVDCDVEVVGNLTLHIGDWSSNKRMSLNGADLTDFLEEDNTSSKQQGEKCYLPIKGYSDDSCDVICLPQMAWNNHCYAFNFATNEVGLSRSMKVRRTFRNSNVL